MLNVSVRLIQASRVLMLLPLVLAGLAGGFLAMTQAPARVYSIEVHSAMFPAFSVDDLAARAEAVILIRPTGHADVHWNSDDRRSWTSADRSNPALIYSDEEMTVEQILRGPSLPRLITVRKYGGTADGTLMIFDDDPDLRANQRYLAFLKQRDTAARSGPERYWTLVAMDLSVFAEGPNSTWTNGHGLTIDESDFARLADSP